jgi:hypothetical protein
MNTFQRIMHLRKSGAREQARALAAQMLQQYPQDPWFNKAMAWIYYDDLKEHIDKGRRRECIETIRCITSLDLDGDQMVLVNLARQCKRIFRSIQPQRSSDADFLAPLCQALTKLNWEKPSEAYSALLEAMVAYKGSWDHRLEALLWWDLVHLRAEDKSPRVNAEGKTYLSLAESAYGAMAKALIDRYNGQLDSTLASATERYLNQLDRLMTEQPHYRFLPYYKARLLMAGGRKEAALAAYVPFVRQHKKQPWAWELLGDLQETGSRQAIACYLRALTCPAESTYLVQCYWKLTRAGIAQGSYPEAKWALDRYMGIRLDNGWSIPAAADAMQNEAWYRTAGNTVDWEKNRGLYLDEAEQLLVPPLIQLTAVISYINEPKKCIHVILAGDQSSFFFAKMKPGGLHVGDILRLGVRSVEAKPLEVWDIEQLPFLETPGLTKAFQARIRVPPGKKHGLANGVFIPPMLMDRHGLGDGARVHIRAIRSYDKRRDRWGWLALSADPPSPHMNAEET